MTKQIGIMIFSPTSTTEKVCRSIAMGMGAKEIKVFDITFPETRALIKANAKTVFDNVDHLIVGSPVHSGKLPVQVIESLNAMEGKGKDCTAVVVYGNRDFGVALFNMVELLSLSGFKITGGGAFIGQHSYSDIVPVALGRPDKMDMEKAFQFGADSLNFSNELNLNNIPRQMDSVSRSEKYSCLKPEHNKKQCIGCGLCAKKCPVGLLSSTTGLYMNKVSKEKCIGCNACVNSCSQKAKKSRANLIIKLVMKGILREASNTRREPLIIIH